MSPQIQVMNLLIPNFQGKVGLSGVSQGPGWEEAMTSACLIWGAAEDLTNMQGFHWVICLGLCSMGSGLPVFWLGRSWRGKTGCFASCWFELSLSNTWIPGWCPWFWAATTGPVRTEPGGRVPPGLRSSGNPLQDLWRCLQLQRVLNPVCTLVSPIHTYMPVIKFNQ